jgi:hypothetical protein
MRHSSLSVTIKHYVKATPAVNVEAMRKLNAKEGVMNHATYTIAKILKIDLLTARKVQTQMGIDGLDFSECSMAEFRQAAKEAYDYLRVSPPFQ